MGLHIRALVVAFALVCFTPTLARATSVLYVALDRSANNVSGVTLYEFLLTPRGLGPLRRQVTIEGIRRSDIVVSHDGRYLMWTVAPGQTGPTDLIVFDRRSGLSSVIRNLGLPALGKLYSDPNALRLFYMKGGIGPSLTILEPASVRTITYGTTGGADPLGLSADGRELFVNRYQTFPTFGGFHLTSLDPLSGNSVRNNFYQRGFTYPMPSATTTRDMTRLYVTEDYMTPPPQQMGRLTTFDLASGQPLASRQFTGWAPQHVTLDEARGRAFVTQSDRLSVLDITTLSDITGSAGRAHVVIDRGQGLVVNVASTQDQSGECAALRLEIWGDPLVPLQTLSADVNGACPTLAIATPPDAPTNPSHQVTGRRVALSWGGVMGATDYEVEAGSATGLSDVARLRTAGVTQLTVDDVPAGTYYVRVRAINDVDLSSPSTEIVVVVPSLGGSRLGRAVDAYKEKRP